MRLSLLISSVAASLAATVAADIPQWGQCGGTGWTGTGGCVAGTICVYLNPWYSQCQVPVTSTPDVHYDTTTTTSSTPFIISTTYTKTVTTTSASRTTTTSPSTTTTTTTGCAYALMPRSTGPPIKAITPGSAISGLFLQRDNSGRAVLTTGNYGSALSFSGGTIYRLEYATSVSCGLVKDYLNVHVSESTASYKPVYWDYANLITNYWGPDMGSPITTTSTSPFGVDSTFLACQEGGEWVLYLQTGTDVPPGETCATTQLQVTSAY